MRILAFNNSGEKIKQMKRSPESLEKVIIEAAKFVEQSDEIQFRRFDLGLRAAGKNFLADIENLKFN